jgi:hypothetical protein
MAAGWVRWAVGIYALELGAVVEGDLDSIALSTEMISIVSR